MIARADIQHSTKQDSQGELLRESCSNIHITNYAVTRPNAIRHSPSQLIIAA